MSGCTAAAVAIRNSISFDGDAESRNLEAEDMTSDHDDASESHRNSWILSNNMSPNIALRSLDSQAYEQPDNVNGVIPTFAISQEDYTLKAIDFTTNIRKESFVANAALDLELQRRAAMTIRVNTMYIHVFTRKTEKP